MEHARERAHDRGNQDRRPDRHVLRPGTGTHADPGTHLHPPPGRPPDATLFADRLHRGALVRHPAQLADKRNGQGTRRPRPARVLVDSRPHRGHRCRIRPVLPRRDRTGLRGSRDVGCGIQPGCLLLAARFPGTTGSRPPFVHWTVRHARRDDPGFGGRRSPGRDRSRGCGVPARAVSDPAPPAPELLREGHAGTRSPDIGQARASCRRPAGGDRRTARALRRR